MSDDILDIDVDTTRFDKALDSFIPTSKKPREEIYRQQGKLLMQAAINITPPADGSTIGAAARKQGEKAIDKDLAKIFIGVQLKHDRPEEYPDVEGLYKLALKNSHGKRFRSRRGVYIFYHVDRDKLAALKQKLREHVGRMASGWYTALSALGGSTYQWIARHGTGRGEIQITTENGIQIRMVNNIPDKASDEAIAIRRRLQNAYDFRANQLEKQVTSYHEKLARDLIKNS